MYLKENCLKLNDIFKAKAFDVIIGSEHLWFFLLDYNINCSSLFLCFKEKKTKKKINISN